MKPRYTQQVDKPHERSAILNIFGHEAIRKLEIGQEGKKYSIFVSIVRGTENPND